MAEIVEPEAYLLPSASTPALTAADRRYWFRKAVVYTPLTLSQIPSDAVAEKDMLVCETCDACNRDENQPSQVHHLLHRTAPVSTTMLGP